jgi:L-alanine-DL-glutamate epimerase and related enzymes of enolase superfamily
MAESPVACMAAVHAAAAVQNILAVEYHSSDCPWWNDLAYGIEKPLIKDGFIAVPEGAGLGITGLNEELIREKIHRSYSAQWAETTEWDKEWANDRAWS